MPSPKLAITWDDNVSFVLGRRGWQFVASSSVVKFCKNKLDNVDADDALAKFEAPI